MKTAPLCQNTINCPSVSRRTPLPNNVPISSNEWNDSSLLTPSNVLMHFKIWYSYYAHPFFCSIVLVPVVIHITGIVLEVACLCCAFWQFLLCILSITTVALYSHSTKIANTHISLTWSLQPLQLKISCTSPKKRFWFCCPQFSSLKEHNLWFVTGVPTTCFEGGHSGGPGIFV